MIAWVNIFRAEVLMGLWLIRVVGAGLPEWREAFKDEERMFPWSGLDRREAYESILPLAGFGAAVLGIASGVALIVPARQLGFPLPLSFVALWVPLASLTAPVIAFVVIQFKMRRERTRKPSFDEWDIDVENNRRFFLSSSLAGIVIAALVALVVAPILPHLS